MRPAIPMLALLVSANYHGDRVIAIMKGNEDKPWQCLGIIRPEELSQMVSSGPCINLDNLYNQ